MTPCGLAAWPCSRAFSRAAPRFSARVFELGLSSLVPALSGSLLSRAAVRQCGRAQPMVDLGADAQCDSPARDPRQIVNVFRQIELRIALGLVSPAGSVSRVPKWCATQSSQELLEMYPSSRSVRAKRAGEEENSPSSLTVSEDGTVTVFCVLAALFTTCCYVEAHGAGGAHDSWARSAGGAVQQRPGETDEGSGPDGTSARCAEGVWPGRGTAPAGASWICWYLELMLSTWSLPLSSPQLQLDCIRDVFFSLPMVVLFHCGAETVRTGASTSRKLI